MGIEKNTITEGSKNMIKVFVTGDLHIGKKYDRYPEIKDRLIGSRFECLDRCVKEAEKEQCDFFVVTGDLFDRIKINVRDVKQVVDILSRFEGNVIVLPGNHDYYTGEEKVWQDFMSALSKVDHNIRLVTDFKELTYDVGEETVSFYPAFCQSKHSEKNNLEWIKSQKLNDSTYHIGLAHGSLAGLSPDLNSEYFLMTERELLSIPMDAWFLGHTHIPYPSDIPEQKETVGYKIYNAGTPEQTDLSNNTEGVCFIVTLDRKAGKTQIAAHSFKSGAVRYFDLALTAAERKLKEVIFSAVKDLPKESVIRLTIDGAVSADEYADRQHIYYGLLNRFLTYEVIDTELSELITRDKIRSEFAEIGFAAELLESLTDPKEVQMAYELIKKHQV